MTSTRALLDLTAAHDAEFLEGLPARSVAPTAELPALRRALGRPLPEVGLSAEEVIDELVRDVEGGIMASAGGRFFGWVIGGGLPAALAADWLAATWDQNAALYACGPAEAVIEEVTGDWLKSSSACRVAHHFAFTTGAQMAHVTDEVMAHIQAGGEAWFGGTTWKGMRAMRISVINWQTSDGDVDRAIAAVEDALARPRGALTLRR